MNKYLEPISIAFTEKFLNGTTKELLGYQFVNDYRQALDLFYEQNIPEGYVVWHDFWEEYTSYIYENPKFQQAQQHIVDKINLLFTNSEKRAIQSRLSYLKQKKQGIKFNEKFIKFKEEISDDLFEILRLISIQRFLYENPDPILEDIFLIIHNGCFPCGIKNDKKTIIVFNPLHLKNAI